MVEIRNIWSLSRRWAHENKFEQDDLKNRILKELKLESEFKKKTANLSSFSIKMIMLTYWILHSEKTSYSNAVPPIFQTTVICHCIKEIKWSLIHFLTQPIFTKFNHLIIGYFWKWMHFSKFLWKSVNHNDCKLWIDNRSLNFTFFPFQQRNSF
jgi:hypothetical protein